MISQPMNNTELVDFLVVEPAHRYDAFALGLLLICSFLAI